MSSACWLGNRRRTDIESRQGALLQCCPGATVMMRPSAEVTLYLCMAPVDMRDQAESLDLLVQQGLGHNLIEAALYIFTNRRRDCVCILYWERNGLCA
jgi:transposase